MNCPAGIFDILVWFAFEPKEWADCEVSKLSQCLAFATWAAISFMAFVIVDLSRFLVSKYSFKISADSQLGIQHGLFSTLFLLFVGTIAAWVVGVFAYLIDLLNPTIQTSAAVGVLWQVTYVQMLARLKGVVTGAGPWAPEAPDEEVPEQEPTIEEEEEDDGDGGQA